MRRVKCVVVVALLLWGQLAFAQARTYHLPPCAPGETLRIIWAEGFKTADRATWLVITNPTLDWVGVQYDSPSFVYGRPFITSAGPCQRHVLDLSSHPSLLSGPFSLWVDIPADAGVSVELTSWLVTANGLRDPAPAQKTLWCY